MKKIAAAAGLILACAISPAFAAKPQPASTSQPAQEEGSNPLLQLHGQVVTLIKADRADEALTLLDEALVAYPMPGLARGMVQLLRGGILAEFGRLPEAAQALDQAAAMTSQPVAYLLLAHVQIFENRAVEASQNIINAVHRDPKALQDFKWENVAELLRDLKDQGHTEARFDLMLAIVWANYDGGEPPGSLDFLKMDAARGLLERGRLEEALPLVDTVIDYHSMLRMLVDRRFEPFWPRLEEKAGPNLARQLASILTALKDARRQTPDDPRLLFYNMNTLRLLGRYDEAIALGEPLSRDMAAVAEKGIDAFWVVNEQAYILATTGRSEEADQLMEKLLALGVDTHPDLVSMAINRSDILLLQGRYEDALRAADWATENGDRFMSDYGRMWTWRHRTCALAALERQTEADETLQRMTEIKTVNRTAYLDALLCHDKLDEAGLAIISNLDSAEDRGKMLASLQNYTYWKPTPFEAMLDARLKTVISRPDVAEAVNAAGRIISVAATGD